MLRKFRRTKEVESTNCIHIQHKVTFNEKEINQLQFATENYVFRAIGKMNMLYLPDKDKQYIVDTANKQLKEADLSTQMMQINQLKAMIGELDIHKSNEQEIKVITAKSQPDKPATLNMELRIIKYSELRNTVYQKFNEFQQCMQLFRTNLEDGEIVKTSNLQSTINGQEQNTALELIEIKPDKSSISDMDEMCNYKIVKP